MERRARLRKLLAEMDEDEKVDKLGERYILYHLQLLPQNCCSCGASGRKCRATKHEHVLGLCDAWPVSMQVSQSRSSMFSPLCRRRNSTQRALQH